MYGYSHFDSEELKDAKRVHYRAVCKLRCLTAALDRTDPEDFDDLMVQIEAAQEAVWEAGLGVVRLSAREAAANERPSDR